MTAWCHLEYRPSLRTLAIRMDEYPEWTGGDVGGKRVLVLCEQGIGAEIMFVRYCAELKRRGAYVMYHSYPELSRLFAGLSFIDEIVGDLGYVQQSREEMEVLFTFLAERYERRSVMITSNLVFSKWDQIFKDPLTTMAAKHVQRGLPKQER